MTTFRRHSRVWAGALLALTSVLAPLTVNAQDDAASRPAGERVLQLQAI